MENKGSSLKHLQPFLGKPWPSWRSSCALRPLFLLLTRHCWCSSLIILTQVPPAGPTKPLADTKARGAASPGSHAELDPSLYPGILLPSSWNPPARGLMRHQPPWQFLCPPTCPGGPSRGSDHPKASSWTKGQAGLHFPVPSPHPHPSSSQALLPKEQFRDN